MDGTTRRSDPQLSEADCSLLPDRRRPGRAEVDPVLVPLFRETGHSGLADDELGAFQHEEDSELGIEGQGEGNVVRGICFGLVLSMPFWLVTALIGVMVLR